MKYRKEGDFVLKNLNFKIKAKSKVGIVGRSGAGKSSIIQALLRLTDIDEGRIFIDHHNNEFMSLKNLR